ncbi:FAD:protein FMN transferase [Cohnella zeiphila]|uniref:FAD:protein FMN transferase n=1 Tax=Cohnella zeiphila TaxID=2761120 RepID=A0A7X0SUA2_9BACL|nr:FAD:protein FMN transferase [Cohnella zeiphila]MBB6735030.1 FAD:protein FMN transferase [Cohnella zeiphila]
MHTFQAMNTQMATLGLPPESRRKAESWFAFVERNLSRFRPDSELNRLNRSAGRPFMASALLFEALTAADACREETGGLFTPYLGGVLSSLGYDRSFEKLTAGRPSPDGEPDVSDSPRRPAAELRATFDERMMSIRLPEGCRVDLGGFAKGWSAEQLAGMLRREGIRTGAVDAGGDIALWGAPERGWEIGVADPRDPDRDLLELRIGRPAGIATSSTRKRSWTDGEGRARHHLIDPATLLPAESDLVQATVVAPRLTQAEVYAKCLIVLGAAAGIPWLEARRPEFGYVLVGRDGSVRRGGALERYAPGGETHARAI